MMVINTSSESEPVIVPNHLIPSLQYDRAMTLSIIVPVKDAPADVFMVLMQHVVQSARNPEKAQKVLEGLDFSNPTDKWFALNSLQEMGVALPLGG
ncbi:MAG TPA: hypothetical protein DDW33_03310 [Ktedonobacter sp.]|jgi:hypothetical protein|nr:hypothetical protein [Ktedonobacter sp.]HBE24698.1 hypothetical protein [Ktedonobacter sp.]HCJ34936.1 hypothetical protein [Ktedonobacter sp.]HCP73539.1 hypothetical protein [Ktedonobacter sp.]